MKIRGVMCVCAVLLVAVSSLVGYIAWHLNHRLSNNYARDAEHFFSSLDNGVATFQVNTLIEDLKKEASRPAEKDMAREVETALMAEQRLNSFNVDYNMANQNFYSDLKMAETELELGNRAQAKQYMSDMEEQRRKCYRITDDMKVQTYQTMVCVGKLTRAAHYHWYVEDKSCSGL